jgi:hypothetical protein
MCDFILEIECFCQFHLEAFRPDLFSAFGFDELYRNSCTFVGSTDTAFDHVPNAKFTAYATNVLRTIAVRKARLAGDHEKARHTCK